MSILWGSSQIAKSILPSPRKNRFFFFAVLSLEQRKKIFKFLFIFTYIFGIRAASPNPYRAHWNIPLRWIWIESFACIGILPFFYIAFHRFFFWIFCKCIFGFLFSTVCHVVSTVRGVEILKLCNHLLHVLLPTHDSLEAYFCWKQFGRNFQLGRLGIWLESHLTSNAIWSKVNIDSKAIWKTILVTNDIVKNSHSERFSFRKNETTSWKVWTAPSVLELD